MTPSDSSVLMAQLCHHHSCVVGGAERGVLLTPVGGLMLPKVSVILHKGIFALHE